MQDNNYYNYMLNSFITEFKKMVTINTYQGYYYSKPISHKDFMDKLIEN